MTRVLSLLATTTVLTMVVAGCALRWETPPPVWPSPGPATVERDQAAQAEQDVLDAADASPLGQWQTAAAAHRLDVWGGVYQAFPSPSPTPDGFAGDIAEATTQARNLAIVMAGEATHPTHRALAISSSLAHGLALWWSRAEPALAADARLDDVMVPLYPDLHWRQVGPGDMDLAAIGEALAALARDADLAAYAYEVAAARAQPEQRTWLRERRAQLLDAADLWQALTDEPVKRERVYALDTTSVTAIAAQATLREFELGLAHTAAALAVENPDHHRFFASAAMEHFQVALGATGGSWADIPALPGVEVEVPAR